MKRTLPGEIWWVDFGLAAKIRPALILSDYPEDDELALLDRDSRTPLPCAAIGGSWKCRSRFSKSRESFIFNKFSPSHWPALNPGSER